ncbi:MAG: hypothetical protein LBK67_11585 [Coriobacteriales bacterium]|nr:hypothetical protein [Coriobacteriales bacterium]
MTHYMELLATNQPWNLILFMAIPVIFAETLAITEFFILLTRKLDGVLHLLNRIAGLAAGPYFLIVFIYLFVTAVIPLTGGGGWRGPFDVIAVGFYLLGVVPYVGLTLLELNVVGKGLSPDKRLRLHAILVSVFLVVAHVAMIFGMLNPELFVGDGAVAPTSTDGDSSTQMDSMGDM